MGLDDRLGLNDRLGLDDRLVDIGLEPKPGSLIRAGAFPLRGVLAAPLREPSQPHALARRAGMESR